MDISTSPSGQSRISRSLLPALGISIIAIIGGIFSLYNYYPGFFQGDILLNCTPQQTALNDITNRQTQNTNLLTSLRNQITNQKTTVDSLRQRLQQLTGNVQTVTSLQFIQFFRNQINDIRNTANIKKQELLNLKGQADQTTREQISLSQTRQQAELNLTNCLAILNAPQPQNPIPQNLPSVPLGQGHHFLGPDSALVITEYSNDYVEITNRFPDISFEIGAPDTISGNNITEIGGEGSGIKLVVNNQIFDIEKFGLGTNSNSFIASLKSSLGGPKKINLQTDTINFIPNQGTGTIALFKRDNGNFELIDQVPLLPFNSGQARILNVRINLDQAINDRIELWGTAVPSPGR